MERLAARITLMARSFQLGDRKTNGFREISRIYKSKYYIYNEIFITERIFETESQNICTSA